MSLETEGLWMKMDISSLLAETMTSSFLQGQSAHSHSKSAFVQSYMSWWASDIIILWQERFDLLTLEYLLLLLAFHRPAVWWSSWWWCCTHFPCNISCVSTKNEESIWQRRDVYLVYFLTKIEGISIGFKELLKQFIFNLKICMMWYHDVAPGAAAGPSYWAGMQLQPESPKERAQMEKDPQPQQSSATWAPWNAPASNPASFPTLPKASIVGCWFVLAWLFFFNITIKKHLVLVFPDET